MKDEIDRLLEASSTPNDLIQIFDLNGHLLYPTGLQTSDGGWPGRNCFSPCVGEISIDHMRMRTANHITTLGGRRMRLCMAGWMEEQYNMLNYVIRSYLLVAPLILLASIGGGLILSKRAMEPLDHITRDARVIGIQALHRRLPIPDTRDKLQRLTTT